MQPALYDPHAVTAWLKLIHGRAAGLTHICSTNDWPGRTFTDPTAAARYVTYLDGEGREGIYARVTTLKAPLAPGKRGGAADTMVLPALWADVDIAGPGHVEGNLPPDPTTARLVVTTSGLPEPSLWIGSGGGLYPIWMLDVPHPVVDEMDQVALGRLSGDWQKVLTLAATRLGWVYGSGVGDLARILRIPGTVNRKAGLARACQVLEHAGPSYSLPRLQATLAAAMAALAPPTPPSVTSTIINASVSNRERIDGDPGTDFNNRATWSEVLTPHGWREHYRADHGTHWTRPGKETDTSATTNMLHTDRLHVFSTNAAPFAAGESYHKFAAYTLLNHHGDFPAATRALLDAGYGERIDHGAQQRELLAGLLGPDHVPVDPPPWREASSTGPPSRYFTENGGLLVAVLTDDVIAIGPLAVGGDDILWSYCGGVWIADRHVVRNRLTALLGDRYRRSHAAHVEDIARARSPQITCDPLGDVINFRNGLLDWRTGQLAGHSSGVLSTVQLSVAWTPDAGCPRFDRYLDEVVPADMISVVWELIGYLMMSGNPLHKAVMLMGTGRNGKGTLLRVIVSLLGQRHVTAVSLQDLVSTRFTTASLFGKIANIAGDIDATYLESTAVFKAITGQDQISAEHKGRDRFDFTPWAVPVFSANEIPASADTTVGYLSRWLAIPFPRDFTGMEDRGLDAKLHSELNGIAAKAIPALRKLMQRGDFERPESGQKAFDEFARKVDQVRSWLGDCCEPIPPHPHNPAVHPLVPRTTLYEAYRRWCARDGHKALQASRFYDRLGGAGATAAIVRGVRGFRGVTVADGAESARSSALGNWWLTDSDGGAARGAGGVQVGVQVETTPEQQKPSGGAGGAAITNPLHVRAGVHACMTRLGGGREELHPLHPPAPLINCRVCSKPLDVALAARWHTERIHPSCQPGRPS